MSRPPGGHQGFGEGFGTGQNDSRGEDEHDHDGDPPSLLGQRANGLRRADEMGFFARSARDAPGVGGEEQDEYGGIDQGQRAS